MAKLEQAVVDSFNSHFRKKANALGKAAYPLALGGQDCEAGADYIFSDSNSFALIEFKYTEKELCKENKKPRRFKLCKLLDNNLRMRGLHDRCHFIAWLDSTTSNIRTNIYRLEICNHHILGSACGLKDQFPDVSARIFVDDFVDGFFSTKSTRSLSITEFEEYLKWLLNEASNASKDTLEVISYDDQSAICRLVRHNSIREAYDWFQSRKPKARK